MPTCFVVMGYGKKPDHEQGRTFDLDKAYQYIIKPAVRAAGYDCVRSDEIQHAGNINIPMYEQLLHADLVIADLSTANLNAFFELGIRYALKPRATIVMAEKGLRIPFDMGQVVIRQYEHLGSGIDYGEVERMKGLLTETIAEVMRSAAADSPVYTFLSRLKPPAIEQIATEDLAAQETATRQALASTTNQDEQTALSTPMASLLDAAMAALRARDFRRARDILRAAIVVQGDKVDHFVVEQLAIATYKSDDLDPSVALLDAKNLLRPLDPDTSTDPEMLEIWATIHQRLFELRDAPQPARTAARDTAIATYERGFLLTNEPRCGINLAYLLDCRAATARGDEAIADRVQARRVRVRVLASCDELLKVGIKGETAETRAEQEYSVRAIRAEALCGLQRPSESHAAFEDAKTMRPTPAPSMIEATNRRLQALHTLLDAQTAP